MRLENEEYMNSYIKVLYSGLKELEFEEKKCYIEVQIYQMKKLKN